MPANTPVNRNADGIQLQLLDMLFTNARTAQWTAIGIGTVTAFLLSANGAGSLVIAWWWLLIAVSAGRLVLFPKDAPADTQLAQARRRWFIASLVLSGLTWGALPFCAGPMTAYQFAICFIVIGGIGAGATTSLAPQRNILPWFLLPSIGGLLAALLVHAPDNAAYLGATLLLYVGAMLQLHGNQHRLLLQAVESGEKLKQSVQQLHVNQVEREVLANRLAEHNQCLSRFTEVTSNPVLDYQSKVKALLNLLRESLHSDGIAVCQYHGDQLNAVHRIDAKGNLQPILQDNHARLAVHGESDRATGIVRLAFEGMTNPVARLFGRDRHAALLVPIQLKGKRFGCLVVAFRRDLPETLAPIQVELLQLAGSWLAMELLRDGAMARLRENRESISELANSIPALVAFISSDLRFRYANTRLVESFDRNAEQIVDMRMEDLFDASTYKLQQPFIRRVLRGEEQEFELEPLQEGGSWFNGRILKMRFSPRRTIGGDVNGFYVLAVDISEDPKEQRRLQAKSSRDTITGLRNRTYFLEQVRLAASDWQPGQGYFLLMMDVVGFRQVNESHGPVQGDRVLREIAIQLDSALRADDLLVRLGGDEFLMVVRSSQRSDAEAVAQRLLDQVARMQFAVRGMPVDLGLSIGISHIDRRFGFKSAYRHADEALLMSKQRGGNCYIRHYA